MAEFCRECFLKLEEDNRLEDQIILSDSLEFCEGCGEWKRIVEVLRRRTLIDEIRDAIIEWRLNRK